MNFKAILAASATALALTGSAIAADLPSRAAPPVMVAPAPIFTWTGFYFGLNAGYTWSTNNSVSSVGMPVPGAGPIGVAQSLAAGNTYVAPGSNGGGFIGGGQVGFNWQFGALVAGIETDFQGIAAGNRASTVALATPVPGFPAEAYIGTITNKKKLDWFGTLRARVGYTVTPTFLLYATGGLAYGGVQLANAYWAFNAPGGYTVAATGVGAVGGTRVGWTVGAGAEYAFSPNWSAKLEYLYYDLGRATAVNFTSQTNPVVFWAGSAGTLTTRFTGHIVRAGVNYRFGWGGPAAVVARY